MKSCHDEAAPIGRLAGALPGLILVLVVSCGGSDAQSPPGPRPDAGTPPADGAAPVDLAGPRDERGSRDAVVCAWESPAAGYFTSGAITLAAVCTQESGIQAVQFQVDGALIDQVAGPVPDDRFTASFDTSALEDGAHRLMVVARANDGAEGTASLDFGTDNTAPRVIITRPEAGSIHVAGLAVTVGASDANGVRSMRALLSGSPIAELPPPAGPENRELVLDVSAVVTGNYTLTIEAADPLGNVGSDALEVRIISAPRFRGASPQTVGVENASLFDVAVGDENADGRPDLWFATNRGVWVRHGLGNGGFAAPVRLVEDGAQRILPADLDGDGQPELLRFEIAGSSSKVIVHPKEDGVWRETVGPSKIYSLPAAPTTIAFADVNGDEQGDVLLGGDLDETCLGVMLAGREVSGPNHTYLAPPLYSTGVTRVRSIAVADFDGDKLMDVVVGRDARFFSVFPGQGDGTFGIARNTGETDGNEDFSEGVAAGDFDGDGVPDVAVTQRDGGLLVYLGDGDWQFVASQQRYASGSGLGSKEVLTADLDGDHTADLLVVNSTGKNAGVFLGEGDGTFTERELYNLGPAPVRARLADFNGDGHLDLVALNDRKWTFVVLLARGGGSFGGAPELRVADEARDPVDLVAGVFDLAHGPDLVVVGDVSSDPLTSAKWVNVHTFHNDGSYPRATASVRELDWSATPELATQGSPVDVRAAELTADARLDLAILSKTSWSDSATRRAYQLNVLPGDGTGDFPSRVRLETSHLPGSFALCDINGDDRPDVLAHEAPATGQPNHLLRFLTLVGTGTSIQLQRESAVILTGAPADVQCGLLNTDVANDYLSVNTDGGDLNYFQGAWTPEHVTDERQVLAIGDRPRRVIIADVDGDGQFDALASVQNNLVIAFGADGGQTFDIPRFLSHPGKGPWGVAVHDFTDDGLPDLAVANETDATISIYVNAGERLFLGPIDFHTSLKPREMVGADFDGDGCEDLAVLNAQGKTVTLLLAEGARCSLSP